LPRIVEQAAERPIDGRRAGPDRAPLGAALADKIDPATRTFQALRIAVNRELDSLDLALRRLPDRLRPGAGWR